MKKNSFLVGTGNVLGSARLLAFGLFFSVLFWPVSVRGAGPFSDETIDDVQAVVAEAESAKNIENSDRKAFTSCGLEWKRGPNDLEWDEAQMWINELGDGWRTPTVAELKALHTEVGQKSPLNDLQVWADQKSSEKAYTFNFRNGYSWATTRYRNNSCLWAVAVRSPQSGVGGPTEKQTTPNERRTFFGCGLEWKRGPNNLEWDEAQMWINELGDGWRTPTVAELKALHSEVGHKSPLNDLRVWADQKSSEKAYTFSFSDGYPWATTRYRNNSTLWVVAVRSPR